MGEAATSQVHPDIELILARQLAGSLALPIVIFAPDGTVTYYNEMAERILGRRFDEAGPMAREDYTPVFQFTNESGELMPLEETPMVAALRTRRPVHMTFGMRGIDGVHHRLTGTAFPLFAAGGRFLGVAGIFYDLKS